MSVKPEEAQSGSPKLAVSARQPGPRKAKTGTMPVHTFISSSFPSYEAAMENSNRPETAEFAAKLAKLCAGPPTFRNLDVVREEEM